MRLKLPRMTRRRFLAALGGTAALTGLYAWRIEPHWVEIVERDLPIDRLPAALDGRRLVQISDLHIGNLVDDDFISSAIRTACSRADVLVITGDFMSTESGEQAEHVARVLEKSLHHPPLGTFAVTGNHDFGRGWKNPAVADRLCERLRDAGIVVLRNQVTDLHGLQIGGLDDLWGGGLDLDKMMASLDPSRAGLVLCHNPDGADISGWKGYRGWILSGHTHGGQCRPPFLDPPIIPVWNPRYTQGEVPLADGRRIYINRALGYIRRVRFNARPEITVFTLRTSSGPAIS